MLGQPLPVPGQAGPGEGTKLCHILADEALLRRMSGNAAGSGEDCVSALRSLNLPDSFWTDEFKVVPCAKTYSHKWTLCPCAHIGETARRRCPRTVNYKAVLCPLVKAKKTCPLGDSCTYAHNTFELWLHPSRYKTRLCSFGRNCNRSICFFAHSAEELRCVPMSDDEKADDSGYLMQLLMAQDGAALLQPAPMPPPLGMTSLGVTDLSSALQHALQCPLPPSNRPSINGLPDGPPTSGILPGRASVNGLSDMLPGPASMTGMQEAHAAAHSASLLAARASLSGLADAPGGIIMPGRHSLNGLAEASSLLGAPPRSSLSGLQDFQGLGGVGGMMRARPSVTGVPGDHPANVLLSMSVQNSMKSMHRALSSELNGPLHTAAMQRALSSDLGLGGGGGGGAAGGGGASSGGPFHAAANAAAAMTMQRALSSDLGGAGSASAPFNAAAAAAMAMERALSRELGPAGGAGNSASPLQSALLERAYSGREGLSGVGVGGLGGAVPLSLERVLTNSRSMGSSAARDIALAHTTSINSVESDSLINMCAGGLAGLGHIGGGAGGAAAGLAAGGGMAGFDLGHSQAEPQGPPRLSDPGSSFHQLQAAHNASSFESEQAGDVLGLFGKDLMGLESLLPLVNNALASGALALPTAAAGGAGVAAPPRRMRRSVSGNSNSNSGRVVSPPLHDGGPVSLSPSQSGTLTPLSPNSAAGGEGGGEVAGLMMNHHHQQQQQQAQQQQAARLVQPSSSSPTPLADGLAAHEAMLRAAAAAGGAAGAAAVAGGGAIDQSYLNDLVARLQDQGVNKEQLVSSLSQLLAQLLSVGN